MKVKNILIYSVLLTLCIFLSSCMMSVLDRAITPSATTEQLKLAQDLFNDPNRSGVFYFQTGTDQFVADMSLSGKYVGRTLTLAFLAAECKPGRHKVSVGPFFKGKCMNIGPSEKLYLQGDFTSGTISRKVIDREEAESLMGYLMFPREHNNIENIIKRPITPRCGF